MIKRYEEMNRKRSIEEEEEKEEPAILEVSDEEDSEEYEKNHPGNVSADRSREEIKMKVHHDHHGKPK